MAKTTKTPHDAIFKSVFEKPEHAAAELRHILPPNLASAVRWSSLTLEPGSFIDPKLAGTHSDLLFSAEAEASGEPLLVYILFEHQSTSDPLMPLRLLGYMVNIWKRYAKSHVHEPLPLIIPALLAQVPGGWVAPTRFSELFSPQARNVGGAILPDFSIATDDLARASDAELRHRGLPDQAVLTLWLMRDIRDRAALFGHLAGWAEVFERLARSPGGGEELLVLLRYMAVVSGGLQLRQFRDTLKGRAPALERFAMTLEEMFDAKAREVGLARAEKAIQAAAKAAAQAAARAAQATREATEKATREATEKATREATETATLAERATSVLTVLEARGLHVSDAERQRIQACTDLEQLEQWLVLAVTAGSTDELFQA